MVWVHNIFLFGWVSGGVEGKSTRAQENREILFKENQRYWIYGSAEQQNHGMGKVHCTHPNNKPTLSKANNINYTGNKIKRLKIQKKKI